MTEIGKIIREMRRAYFRGDNAMKVARDVQFGSNDKENTVLATLVAYDLQAGSYIRYHNENPEFSSAWCLQLSEIIAPYLSDAGSVLELGVGEATTLKGVINKIEGGGVKTNFWDSI